jgi:hypothetical protein
MTSLRVIVPVLVWYSSTIGIPRYSYGRTSTTKLHTDPYRSIQDGTTVALIEFASRTLPVKVHIKKKSGGRKTRRCLIENQIPYQTQSSFFRLWFFLGVHFYRQNPGTYLHHTVSMVGLPDSVLLIFPGTCTAVPVLWCPCYL